MIQLIANMSNQIRFDECVAIAHNGMSAMDERIVRRRLKDSTNRRVWMRMGSWAFRYKNASKIEWRHYRREYEIMHASDYADLMGQVESYCRKHYEQYPYQAHYTI